MNLLKNIILLFLLGSLPGQAEEYTFGEGWQVADSPVVIGGYFSSEYAIMKDSRYFDVDDIAFMAYGEFDQFDFMAELEAADVYKNESGHLSDESTNTSFHIERLYGDYHVNGDHKIRAGKFNSDIGFWNQMPINVLRETTSSPVLTEDFFPKLTTGIHYEQRSLDMGLDRVSMTLQHNEDLDEAYNNYQIDRHYSIACDVAGGNTLWRMAGGFFRYHELHEALYLLGAVKRDTDEWSFLAESVLQEDIQEKKFFYDIYGQAVWHFQPRHNAIVRAEIGKSPRMRTADSSVLMGYTYRPLPNVALKGEVDVHPDDSDLNRLLLSFSVLF